MCWADVCWTDVCWTDVCWTNMTGANTSWAWATECPRMSAPGELCCLPGFSHDGIHALVIDEHLPLIQRVRINRGCDHAR
jgi:hypothetical protein